jgi:hypothetical protein
MFADFYCIELAVNISFIYKNNIDKKNETTS